MKRSVNGSLDKEIGTSLFFGAGRSGDQLYLGLGAGFHIEFAEKKEVSQMIDALKTVEAAFDGRGALYRYHR